MYLFFFDAGLSVAESCVGALEGAAALPSRERACPWVALVACTVSESAFTRVSLGAWEANLDLPDENVLASKHYYK